MIKRFFYFVYVLMVNSSLFAQKTVEEVNYLLDTQPYFGFRIDYHMELTLPDSVKQKLLIALNGRLTPHLKDSLLVLTLSQKEILLEKSRQQCNGDSICIEETYRNIIKDVNKQNIHFYTNQPISGQLVLAAGNWNIREAIPLLENALYSKKYSQQTVLMALAKLGNDSVKQILIEKYTLSYILKTTDLDTINDNAFSMEEKDCIRILYEGMQVAKYLKNKDILLNLTDLIYIRGKHDSNISISDIVSFVVNEFDDKNYFNVFPNYDKLEKICYDYAAAIWGLSERSLNKKQKKELEILLSTEYRTKIRNQIRDWIIENVNFENK